MGYRMPERGLKAMTIMKERLIDWFNRVKIRVMENKQRTGALLCALLALIGFFLPFMSAGADVRIMNQNLAVMTPDYDMINFSLIDFVLQEPIDDFKLYGVPLGNFEILNQSVLEMLRNPLPDQGYVSSVNDALSSPVLDYLVDPKVQEIVATRFRNGGDINAIFGDLWSMVQSARNIVVKVNDVTIQARQSMDQVNAAMATIDGYKATANGLMLILFLLIIGLMALILYKRASIRLSIFLSGLLSTLFVAVGIGTAVVNNKINAQLASWASQINNGIVDALRAVLTGTFGDVGTFIANYISGQANFLVMAFNLQLEAGYWISLLGLLGTLILLIVTARKEQQIKVEAEIQTELDESALNEEIDEVIEVQKDLRAEALLNEASKMEEVVQRQIDQIKK